MRGRKPVERSSCGKCGRVFTFTAYFKHGCVKKSFGRRRDRDPEKQSAAEAREIDSFYRRVEKNLKKGG